MIRAHQYWITSTRTLPPLRPSCGAPGTVGTKRNPTLRLSEVRGELFWWRCSHVPHHCFREWFFFVPRRTNNQEKPQINRPSLLINRATPWERGQRLTASLNPPTCSLYFLIDADGWKKKAHSVVSNSLLPISEGTVDPDMHDSRASFAHASWFCTFLRLSPPSGGKICFWCRAGFCLWTLTRSPFVRSDAKKKKRPKEFWASIWMRVWLCVLP